MGLLANASRTGFDIEGGIYRVTQTFLAGQYADDACIRAWIDNTPGLTLIDAVLDDANDGGPNDRRYILWHQAAQVPLPTACKLTLVTSAGKNGWAVEADARKVLDRMASQDARINESVEQANEAALNPLNWETEEGGKPSQWGWVKYAVGGAVVVAGIYSVAKLVRG